MIVEALDEMALTSELELRALAHTQVHTTSLIRSASNLGPIGNPKMSQPYAGGGQMDVDEEERRKRVREQEGGGDQLEETPVPTEIPEGPSQSDPPLTLHDIFELMQKGMHRNETNFDRIDKRVSSMQGEIRETRDIAAKATTIANDTRTQLTALERRVAQLEKGAQQELGHRPFQIKETTVGETNERTFWAGPRKPFAMRQRDAKLTHMFEGIKLMAGVEKAEKIHIDRSNGKIFWDRTLLVQRDPTTGNPIPKPDALSTTIQTFQRRGWRKSRRQSPSGNRAGDPREEAQGICLQNIRLLTAFGTRILGSSS